MSRRLSQEEFENKVKQMYGDDYEVIGKYINKRSQIELIHKCGYTFSPYAGGFLQGKIKCPMCNQSTKLNTEIVKNKINDKFGSDFELLNEYKDSITPIKIRHKTCGNSFEVSYSNFIRYVVGCPLCAKKSQSLSDTEFKRRVSEISNGQIIPLEKYINSNTKIKFLYVPDNITFYSTPGCIYQRKKFCFDEPKEKICKKIFYPISESRPDIFNLLKNKEDGYRYSYGTKKKLKFICPNCHGDIVKQPMYLFSNTTGSITCPRCNDGFSYPEKFISNFLYQNKTEYVYQLTSADFDWCNKYRYDFYITEMNWIIEVNGIQHYQDSGFGTYEDVHENDLLKKELALKNGIDKYIVIDARFSDMDYISNSILSSELSDIIKYEINWDKCDYYASGSIFLKVCSEWNGKFDSIDNIVNKYQIHKNTVLRYLKKGSKIGIIDFNFQNYLEYSKLYHYKKIGEKEKKPILCVETGIRYDSIKEAQDLFCKTSKNITKALHGHLKTAYGFHWKFVN